MRVHQYVWRSWLWLALSLSISVSAQAQLANEALLSLDTHVVSLNVTVTDKRGRHVPNLSQTAFTVYEDQVAQEISFFNQADTPASIAVVFDLSGSMQEEKLVRAKAALERFLANCHREDEYSLIGFNQRAWVALGYTRDSQQLLRQFGTAQPEGHTALYDAVALGLTQLTRGTHQRRVLLVISDGEDNRSRASFRQLKRQAQESSALIYAIGITDLLNRRRFGEFILEELTTETGGKAYFPRNAEAMSEAFESIALELRQQYSIGYTPSNFAADGKWRKLKVKVTPPPETPSLVVRVRAGYYANLKGEALTDDAEVANP